MKNIFLLLGLFFLFQEVQSQAFKPSLFAAVNASASKSTTNKIKVEEPGFGYSIFIKEECYLPQLLSIGGEIGYSNIKTIFQTQYPYLSIPEITNYIKNSVTENQLEIPITIKLRGKKENRNFYVFAGAGINYIFSSYRKVDHVSYDIQTPGDKNIAQVLKGNFSFVQKNSIGNFSIFGLGKNFLILGQKLFVELRYRNDLTSWAYPTSFNVMEKEISMRVRSVSFNMGYIF